MSPKEGAVPVWRLSNEAGVYVAWTDGGKVLTWVLGPTFYRLPLATAIQFAQEREAEGRREGQGEARGEGRGQGDGCEGATRRRTKTS